MRKVKFFAMLWLSVLLVGGMAANAAIVPLTVHSEDFGSLGNLVPVAGWGAMTTTMEQDSLKGVVTSQSFLDTDTQDYYYFYQISNAGVDVTWHAIETFTVCPFNGSGGAATELGYLTGNEPAGFSAGTETPVGASINTDAGPVISFNFPGYVNPIAPGEVSKVLYVKSSLPPQVVLGNIIDGSIAQGDVIGTVPEPAMISLFCMGALALLRKHSYVNRI